MWTLADSRFVPAKQLRELVEPQRPVFRRKARWAEPFFDAVFEHSKSRLSTATSAGAIQNGTPVAVCSRNRRMISTVMGPGVPHPIL